MIVSFDLDSTLCDTAHRQHLVNREEGGVTDWDAYSMACADDAPGPGLPLALAFQQLGARLVVCSARSVGARKLTDQWLREQGLRVLAMRLREEGDHTKHIEWKAQAVKDLSDFCEHAFGEPIALHVDDWPAVKDATEKLTGIPTVIVHVEFAEVGYART